MCDRMWGYMTMSDPKCRSLDSPSDVIDVRLHESSRAEVAMIPQVESRSSNCDHPTKPCSDCSAGATHGVQPRCSPRPRATRWREGLYLRCFCIRRSRELNWAVSHCKNPLQCFAAGGIYPPVSRDMIICRASTKPEEIEFDTGLAAGDVCAAEAIGALS